MEDLSRLFECTGPWNAVLFSGDLTQQAKPDEYSSLDEVLDEIWKRFATLGADPTLVTVPGNHDLAWPNPVEAVMLQPYWESDVLRNGLFDGAAATQKRVIETAFGEYCAWRERQIRSGRHATPIEIGIMPGDASYQLSTEAGQVGVIALNSAWLQLTRASFEGKLALDVRQLLAVTNNDADAWCAKNDANLLMTHHPVNWLSPESRAQWKSEICPPDRFDLHLFGHMHQQDFTTISRGGGGESRAAQSAALFGLKYLPDGTTERIQGYSLNKIESTIDQRDLTVWPRVLTELRDGSQELTPDVALGLNDGSSFTKRYAKSNGHVVTSNDELELSRAVTLERSPTDITAELEKIRYFLPDDRAHRNVRRLELHRAARALERDRVVWVAADWGMGEDGFLSAIQYHFGEVGVQTYRFDLSEYVSREQFLSEAQARFGASFETLCEDISTVGPSYILFNDVPVDRPTVPGEMPVERDIEALAKLVTEFASQARVLLRAQRQPRNNPQSTVVEIKALDEADVAIYLRDSPEAGEALVKSDKVGQMHRITDGVPSRIDSAIRELEVTSLDDLINANSDLGPTAVSIAAPRALISAVAELEASGDSSDQRTFNLLKALSALPQGEQLSHIARLNGPVPFRSSHAIDLTSRALLDSVPLAGLGVEDSATSKTLIVPRPVREYVRSRLSDEEARSLDRKLLTLFFGENWRNGLISSSRAGKRASNSLCQMHEITNSSTLIVRLLRRAVDEQASDDIDSAIALASAFSECLVDGNHYRGAVALCDDALHFIPAGRDRQTTIIRFERARALRMIHKLEEACEALESLDYDHLSKDQRQSAKLNLALAYQSLKRHEEAKQAARDCIAIDRKSSLAVQAESIIARQISDREERINKLRSLSIKSGRRNNSAIATNNIGMSLVYEAKNRGDLVEARRLLRDVIDRARREGDFYNGARAIAELAQSHPADEAFPAADKVRLIDAYHFAHSERRAQLFDQCHAALWKIFENELEVENLLSLFRHSSFIWRINGRENSETRYLERLNEFKEIMRRPSRNLEYFYVRVVIILGIESNIEPINEMPS